MAKTSNKKKNYKVVYARKSWAADALGHITSYGMEIMDSSKRYIGYMPYTNWRTSGRIRKVFCYALDERCLVKVLPPRKR